MKVFFIYWALCSLAGNSLGGRLPVIQNATFQSTNFENIFTWKIQEGTPPGTLYNVQYKTYGHSIWQSKPECQNITQNVCNLTNETENVTEYYHARVRAVVPNCCISDWATSLRFCPSENINIENIDVKYTPSIQSIQFVIQPPYTPLKDENNSPLTVVDILKQLDINFQYEIIICCTKTKLKWKTTEYNEQFNITQLDPNTEYNGTIHIRHADKISKSCVFQVRTLSDNTWVPYLFGMVIFIILFTFGTVLYFMYKYVKQHTIQQPTSLDFKGISHFQPLILNVEHALNPYDSSKIIQPGVHSAEIIQGMQEDQKLFNPTMTSYQQQSKMPPFQPLAQPLNGLSVGYAPQVIKNRRLRILRDNPSTLTYGLCIEGASHKANRGIKLDSFLSNGHYKAQRPERTNKEWTTIPQKEGLVVETIPKIQHHPLQENAKGPPQESPRLLGEWRPTTVDRSGGSYRKQAEVLPSSLEVGQSAILEGGDSLSPPHLIAHFSCHNLPQDPSTGQLPAFCLSAWTDNFLHSNPFGCQITDYLAQESQGLKSEPQSLDISPNILDLNQLNGPFPNLFNDLELKLQWDGSPEEATS